MIDILIDKQELEKMRKNIGDIQQFTKRSMRESVKYMTIAFAQSARKGTSYGAKQRKPIEPIKGSEFRNGKKVRISKHKYRFARYSQNKPVRWIKTNKKKDKRRLIKTRGLGKNSWGILLRDMSPQRSSRAIGEARGKRLAKKYVTLTKRLKAFNPSVELENRISYMLKVNPDVVRVGLRKANASVKYRIENSLSRYYRKKGF